METAFVDVKAAMGKRWENTARLTTTTRTTFGVAEVKVNLIRVTVARLALSAVLVALALTSCSAEPGDPSAETATTTTARSTVETTSASAEGSSSLADFKPCPVFESIASQFGLTKIEEGDSTSCDAVYSDSVSVRLDIYPDAGLADYSPGLSSAISDTSVRGRKAKLVEKALTSSSCAVAVEVSTSSRVDIAASADASLDEACDAATEVAAAVEPKLPR
ncbi:ABC-type phosphate transport system substrate-binding protein [Saccharothrix coeruleofusca]|uniref:hypothetical protein n=1 Tax=Saccharothrix coeruleofusca TaxID=33919 RepID=UPI001AE85FC9|nr:hypothetical protein [Saccharothrix coeruleofusca]MBP2339624.1 ABC-type phosphate transport system substrate-binding protein [Saccharothrix coeruleofusca]